MIMVSLLNAHSISFPLIYLAKPQPKLNPILQDHPHTICADCFHFKFMTTNLKKDISLSVCCSSVFL